ncbi:hypothetical protein LDENG_00195190 [Lucifuga dentata]|nr:hypothetical protein LDENG_00195190 [Lucifuga dentata]
MTNNKCGRNFLPTLTDYSHWNYNKTQQKRTEVRPALTSPWPLTSVSITKACPTCKRNQGIPSQSLPSADVSVTALAFGEPCGVYTLSCAHGLRCSPPEDGPRPLRALLEGRGICSNTSRINPTEKVHTADSEVTEDPHEAPCRKLLTTLVKGLDAHLFQSHHDIYVPNCDKRGFFRKKQCWSSRGKQRGKCWCVDDSGTPMPSYTKHKGTLLCQSS